MRTSTSLALGCGVLALVVLCGAGCGDDDVSAADAGQVGDAGAETCTIPDTVCPADMPLAGAACDTSMMCMYPDPGGTYTWSYHCDARAWVGASDCDPTMVPPGGSCPVGPLAESCRPPFAGMLSGATIEIGDSGTGAFRPFTSGERVSLITGGQGSPMVGFRVRVSGAGVPRCVGMTTTLMIDSTTPTAEMRNVALHCGTTLPVFQIVPDPCDTATHALDIKAEIAGIGSTHVTVEYVGPPCVG